LDDRSKALIWALLYPIQFEKDPRRGIERVMLHVVAKRAPSVSLDDYVRVIAAGLESDESLSALIPHSHNEETVREYLAEFQKTLIAAGAAAPAAPALG
jgi:hypothetical protein